MTASASDRVFTNEIGDPIRPDSVGQAAGVPTICRYGLRHIHASHVLKPGQQTEAAGAAAALLGPA